MNKAKLAYTLKHKWAYLLTEYKLTGKISKQGLLHDLDKVWAFMLTNKSEIAIKTRHRAWNRHHHFHLWYKLPKHVLIEMAIDWESSPITKPDKPQNAYQYLQKNYFY